MTLTQTSDAQSGDSPARLAATETPVLASNQFNSHDPSTHGFSYNGAGAMDNPKSSISFVFFEFLKNNWKTLGVALVAAGYVSFPASTTSVEKVKVEAASELKLAEERTAGKLNVIERSVADLKEASAQRDADLGHHIEIVQGGVNEILLRLPERGQPSQAQVTAASPAAPPENPQTPRKIVKKKPQPVAVKPVSGWSLFR